MTSVVVRSGHNYQQEIVTKEHVFFADEPIEAGGDDTGPNPYELLLGALGSCTSITLLMYARRKQWPLEQVEVELTHRRDYLEDCRDCETKDTRIEVIEVSVMLTGNLSAEQHSRLHEIARRCPVNQTLSRGIKTVHLDPSAHDQVGQSAG